MSDAAAEIAVERLTKSFATASGRLPVLAQVDFRAGANEFIALLGPSGCGKSTILRMVAGLEPFDGGRILVGGAAPDPRRHRVGFVFQGDSLLPWRTIAQNVGFGLENTPLSSADRARRVDALLALVGLAGFEAYFPYQLSGGMRQRAAVARAFAIEPAVLLMDEPFGSLDVQMRGALQRELLKLWERIKTTVLFVTHDVEEAVFLADRVVVMTPRPGRVRAVVPVTLPRPRDPLDAASVALRRELGALLQEVPS